MTLPQKGVLFICRPMTFREWMSLPPKQRASALDMTGDTPKRTVRVDDKPRGQ